MDADKTGNVFIEPPGNHGWRLRGRSVRSSHLITDLLDLTELHRVAQAGGMKREWFQNDASSPHYDIAESCYAALVAAGATPVNRHGLVAALRRRRAAEKAAADLVATDAP